MGNCIYCGKPAGFFRSKHSECEERNKERERAKQHGYEQVVEKVQEAIKGIDKFERLESTIAEIERSLSITSCYRQEGLIKGWENAVESFLDDGILDTEEESRLIEFKNYFSLGQSDLDRKGAYTKIAKSAILRDVLEGIIPKRVSIDGNLPINFQKGEQIIWAFPNTKYLEDKTRRQFVGGSHGLSIRIAKGLYYRVGAFKGYPVEHTERIHVDMGWFVVTNKNLYFAGPRKSFRIPYTKIVSFEPYNEGIGVMRDATTAKPQVFLTDDGWFTYNLITNLSRM